MKTMQKGFTLIELMIVVAIIGILAAIAIPAYQDYTVRAKVSEAVVMLSGAATASTDWYVFDGSWPKDNDQAGLEEDIKSKYVKSLEVTGDEDLGELTATLTEDVHKDLADKELIFTANDEDGAIEWLCSVTDADFLNRYLPPSCRTASTDE